MRIFTIVNDACDFKPQQTSSLLVEAACDRGATVACAGVVDLEVDARGNPSTWSRIVPKGGGSASRLATTMRAQPQTCLAIEAGDIVLMRTNPGRDLQRGWAHETALAWARRVSERGARVVNHPDGLARAATKLYLASMPQNTIPKTLVTHQRSVVSAFLSSLGTPCVIKPAVGSRGRDVFLLDPRHTTNHSAIIDSVLRSGYAIVQELVGEAGAGDVRVVVVGGKALNVRGSWAALARRPAAGDFRGNLHAGGDPTPVQPTPGQLRVIESLGPILVRHGIHVAGLDFVNDKVIEINAFSPGGLWAAEQMHGVGFAAHIVETLPEIDSTGPR